MRLLLINPRFPESFWSSKWALAEVLPNKRTMGTRARRRSSTTM
jgi:hypothetical protein